MRRFRVRGFPTRGLESARPSRASGGSGSPSSSPRPPEHAFDGHRVPPLLSAHPPSSARSPLRESSKPPTTDDHEPYSKPRWRVTSSPSAASGHERFAVVVPTAAATSPSDRAHPPSRGRSSCSWGRSDRRALPGPMRASPPPGCTGLLSSLQAGGGLNQPGPGFVVAPPPTHGRRGIDDLRKGSTTRRPWRDGRGYRAPRIDRSRRGRPPAGRKVGVRHSCSACVTTRGALRHLRPIWAAWADIAGPKVDSGHHMSEEAPRCARVRAARIP